MSRSSITATLAMPLSKMAADPVAGRGMRLVKVEEAERQQLRQQVAQLHQFREQRLQQEREGARALAAGGAAAARPRPMNLPHSPIASRPAHPAGSQAALARRSEEGHPAASHAEAARRIRYAAPAPRSSRRRGSPRGS